MNNNINMENKITVEKIPLIICSCDKYSILWENLFLLLDRYWKDKPKQILGTQETITFKNDNICVKPVGSGFFSNRLKKLVKQIKSKYVFLFIEDHYLENNVKNDILTEAINILETNNRIGYIKLFHYEFSTKPYNSHFEIVTKQNYRISIGPSIWRTKYLKKLLRNGEDVWRTEYYSNLRSNMHRYKVLQISNTLYNPFPLTFGGIVVKGTLQQNLCDKIEKKENIKITFENAKNIEISYKNTSSRKKKSLLRFIRNRFLILYHLLKLR